MPKGLKGVCPFKKLGHSFWDLEHMILFLNKPFYIAKEQPEGELPVNVMDFKYERYKWFRIYSEHLFHVVE